MKNILIPTAFSDCAKVKEEIGFDIAKKSKCYCNDKTRENWFYEINFSKYY